MKFTQDTYNLISECVEDRINSTEDKEELEELYIALEELDNIGIY